jgi:hypothetical protein
MQVEAVPGRIAFCAIATSSHLAAARRALRSFGHGAPHAELVLLSVDAPNEGGDGIRTLAAQACLPQGEFEEMRARYTAAELCFALKPYLLAALLDDGCEQVHYVDADCRAYGALAPLIKDLAAADLLLTPHVLQPIPDDGATPSALTVLRAGSFNGGYIGVRATAAGREFSRWLGAMTREHAYNQPAKGMCGDQRWLDLVPVLFTGLRICRRRGANVGYWNLHERPLARVADGSYTAGDEPLMFFHFSGYDPARPMELSRHQNRHAVIAGGPLHQLVQEYAGVADPAELVDLSSPRQPRRRTFSALFSRSGRKSDREQQK